MTVSSEAVKWSKRLGGGDVLSVESGEAGGLDARERRRVRESLSTVATIVRPASRRRLGSLSLPSVEYCGFACETSG